MCLHLGDVGTDTKNGWMVFILHCIVSIFMSLEGLNKWHLSFCSDFRIISRSTVNFVTRLDLISKIHEDDSRVFDRTQNRKGLCIWDFHWVYIQIIYKTNRQKDKNESVFSTRTSCLLKLLCPSIWFSLKDDLQLFTYNERCYLSLLSVRRKRSLTQLKFIV